MQKTKTINIYITEEHKHILNMEYKNKYHVSLSTLAEKLFLAIYLTKTTTIEQLNFLLKDYIYKTKNKTSIKPRQTNLVRFKENKETIFYSNVLTLLAKNELDKIGNKRKIKSYLIKELIKVRETYYNLNDQIRVQARAKMKLKYLENK